MGTVGTCVNVPICSYKSGTTEGVCLCAHLLLRLNSPLIVIAIGLLVHFSSHMESSLRVRLCSYSSPYFQHSTESAPGLRVYLSLNFIELVEGVW